MHNLGFALDGAWRVLLAGLLLGAGLPVLFALGIRSLAWGAGEASVDATGVTPGTRRPLGTFVGYLLFAVVIAGVLLGLTFIVATGFGNKLSFEHIYPTIVPK
ncbi:hypothetical protein [Actinoplanes teichomyceticus]|uniref:Transmembrane protein n=1 Tax=Actinoplanes teichomyceticus TaxID=1867 RepID=A0A561W9V9_ACTTI|nr:hypothetical protein [Actinoplanes teichomyceticus]TWG20654.1 hypothetical protein FHX34_103183 [Actinoplanes teichomyceticus]GIF14309.1 hypothetical protein Ate01nite_43410 [Actinoplanes teichomyceticus]